MRARPLTRRKNQFDEAAAAAAVATRFTVLGACEEEAKRWRRRRGIDYSECEEDGHVCREVNRVRLAMIGRAGAAGGLVSGYRSGWR